MRAARAAVIVALLVVALPVHAGDAGGAPTPWSVSATPTVGIADGQSIAIEVRSTNAFPLYAAEAHVCRAGVAYQGSTSPHIRPNHDFDLGGPNCPSAPISSSADSSAVASTSLYSTSTTPEGEVFTFRSGSGVVQWSSATGLQSLTCDARNPCALVVELQGGPGSPTWFPVVIPLTYHDADPIAGCGGPAPGIVPSGGSDRLSDAWVAWTLGACDGLGAPTRASFDGEGTAVQEFAAGELDVAYTGLGADAQAVLAPSIAARPALAVPLALNAAVLAVGNGRPGNNGKKVPYQDIKLTLAEVAALLSGGQFGIEPQLDAIYARNPELAGTGFFDTSSPFITGGTAPADAVSLFATERLHQLRPEQWRVPSLPSVFGVDAGRERGVDPSLALAVPGYQNALTLLTGRPALQRNLVGLGGTDYGGIWVLTDLATATALGLTPVQIEDGAGASVAPTPASLAAAVPQLVPGADGTLRPDPAAGSVAGSYPLTFVEYALVPREPLLTPECVRRPDSQALLADYLAEATGDGQTALPPGLVSLPTGLADTAAAAALEVGVAETTGVCAGRVTDPSDPSGPLGPLPPDLDVLPAAGAAGFAGVVAPVIPGGVIVPTVTAVPEVVTPSPEALQEALAKVASQRHLSGLRGAGTARAVLALVAMAVLASLSAKLISGRRRSESPAGGDRP